MPRRVWLPGPCGREPGARGLFDDLVAHAATGVIHGPAGVGKTFAVQANLERLRDTGEHRVSTCSLSFPSKPTMLRVAAELVTALTGTQPSSSRNRFYLINHLVGLLSGPPRLLVVDEAQRLNGECIELLPITSTCTPPTWSPAWTPSCTTPACTPAASRSTSTTRRTSTR